MPKKKTESMLTRQRRLLKEQRAKKAAAKAAQKASQKKIPAKGQTTANKSKAKIQRGLRRDAMAKQQLQNFGRAFKKTLKQSSAQSKLDKAAKGTRGTGVRTAQGKGALAKRPTNQPASQRVQKVKVKVDPPKQLTGSSTPKSLPPSRKALPQGQKGGAIKPKVKPTGSVSAKRAQAAARQARAAQGTKSPTVRTGQPAGSANRIYGANRVNAAVARATRAGRGVKVKGGLAGLAMAALSVAGASGGLGKKVQDSMANDEARMDRFLKNPLKKDTTEKRKPSNTKKTSGQTTNRRGRVVNNKPNVSKSQNLRAGRTPDKTNAKTTAKPTVARDLRAGRTPDTTPKSTPTRRPTPAGKVPSQPIPKVTPKSSRPFGGDPAPKPSQIKTTPSSKSGKQTTTPPKQKKKDRFGKTMTKNRMYLLRRQGRL